MVKQAGSLQKRRAKRLSKKYTMFKPKIRSRHPSHSPLRKMLKLLPFRSVVRLGSTTNVADSVSNGGSRVECNTITAIRNSADKLLMKQCFQRAGVVTSKWTECGHFNDFQADEGFPLVIKRRNSSRGRGIYLIKSLDELSSWCDSRPLSVQDNYIMERFYTYSREYRLHVSKDGCFYTNRKMLREDVPDNKRWYRNDSNCVWILEDNSKFDKPVNWNTIISECVKALKSVGLDVGACDVKVQSSRDKDGALRENPEFIVIEINSAPSFADGTLTRYLDVIPKILTDKKNA